MLKIQLNELIFFLFIYYYFCFQANESFEQQKYTLAINLYNKAISYCPTAAVLFANRAAAYMKRTWYEFYVYI